MKRSQLLFGLLFGLLFVLTYGRCPNDEVNQQQTTVNQLDILTQENQALTLKQLENTPVNAASNTQKMYKFNTEGQLAEQIMESISSLLIRDESRNLLYKQEANFMYNYVNNLLISIVGSLDTFNNLTKITYDDTIIIQQSINTLNNTPYTHTYTETNFEYY